MNLLSNLYPRFGALCLFVICGGCFGSVADIRHHHYTLGGPVRGTPSGENATPNHALPLTALVRVRDLQVDALYDRAALVLRRSPTEVRFWQNDVWAVRPGRMLADALAHALQHAHAVTGVTRELGELRPDYTLSGEVTALEVDHTGPKPMAHLDWLLQLTHNSTGDVVWQDQFCGRTEVATRARARGPAVVGLDILVQQAMQQAVVGISQALAKPNPAAAPEHSP